MQKNNRQQLDLRFREYGDNGDKAELNGNYRMVHILMDALTPKCKAILTKWKKNNPKEASEMANVNITNHIIEWGSDRDAHYLMIYDELISVFDQPDLAGINEGY